jgi:uncharacterized membrane protein YagU involved in acid resistance
MPQAATRGNTFAHDLARGAAAGAAGWWAMDQVLRSLYNHEDPRVRQRESEARNGVPALEVLAEKLAGLAGVVISDKQRQTGGTVLQWAIGIGAGMLYGALRRRLPRLAAGRGLVYGAAFSLVVDEGAVPLLGLSPGPRAFPWQTHARGFLGHLVFGAVAETVCDVLDGVRRHPRLQGPDEHVALAGARGGNRVFVPAS